ncbi:hypothetical protein [Actinoplanes sp. NPDC049802]|uniref:hypothetical protein n=1 Tax=Actinoplanes sp. NPDC049802 TaxID=3154742 RepID=UPI0033D3D63A
MIPRYPFVFEGGPLDGHEIEAIRRTALYRDAAGEPLRTAAGARLSAGGGIYAVGVRPSRVPVDGRIVRRPGTYRWLRPVRVDASR